MSAAAIRREWQRRTPRERVARFALYFGIVFACGVYLILRARTFTIVLGKGVPWSEALGMVFVNGVGLDAPELPFGGTKRSGFGRELGTLGIEEFINKKMIRING